LSGVDDFSGKDYSYRNEWIRQRIEKLASVFAVDVSKHPRKFALLSVGSNRNA
jgi:hypothetical protein